MPCNNGYVRLFLFSIFTYFTCLWELAYGRARLIEPTMRSSLWRLGDVNVPMNYLDELLNCGGFYEQWQNAAGRCGACGDAYNDVIKQNEYPGIYSKQAPIKTIQMGQKLNVTVYTRQNLLGYFEFRLCPRQEGPVGPNLETCFKTHPALVIEETNSTRYYTGSGREYYDMHLRMPEGLSCQICVLQWKYHTGYRMGRDHNGCKECLGCGPQEEFINCADIRILGGSNSTTNGHDNGHGSIGRSGNNHDTTVTNNIKSGIVYTYPRAGLHYAYVKPNTQPSSPTTSSTTTTPTTTVSTTTTTTTTPTTTTQTTTTTTQATTTMTTAMTTTAISQSFAASSTASSPPQNTTQQPCNERFRNIICGPAKPQQSVKGMYGWCSRHCRAGSCPDHYCMCFCEYPDGAQVHLNSNYYVMNSSFPKTGFPVKTMCYVPTGQWRSNPGMNLWCQMNCPGASCERVCVRAVCI
ncbi:uncharacterized protein LOC124131223 [Haliotis rufescens]|uniref:uncharacterized protein LOC124131223 n=1 Tax=Haliotis rufescens TaxID=6454 RepID=UPI001EB068DD|nr:uncharacterized protein LOC124131223 [Haliotis rufescens]